MAKQSKAPFAVPQWPAASVEMRPLSKIKPYASNPRRHPQAQIEALAADMKTDGVTMPILIDDDGVIIAGHGRLLAAALAGFEEYPVVTARGWTEQRKRAVRIKDNQVALLSTWDSELIRAEVVALKAEGFNTTLLGFSEVELRRWGVAAAGERETDPDIIPQPKKGTARVGDVWALGPHRMLVGDSTDPENWKRLFGQARASMIFTDPPYGVDYVAPSGDHEIIKGDEKRRDDLYGMLVGAFKNMARYSTPTAAAYIWHASVTREDFAQALKAANWTEKQYIMWVKPGHAFGRADYQWAHEPAFYCAQGNTSPAFYGQRSEPTVWYAAIRQAKDVSMAIGSGLLILDGNGNTLFIQSRAPKGKKLRQVRIDDKMRVILGADTAGDVWQVGRDGATVHPTQKPVELARRAIENSSRPGEIIADAFGGSFTTLIGAEMTGRCFYGMDLDEKYCDVGITRWMKYTGKIATLNGKTYEQVTRERLKQTHAHSDARLDARRASGKSNFPTRRSKNPGRRDE